MFVKIVTGVDTSVMECNQVRWNISPNKRELQMVLYVDSNMHDAVSKTIELDVPYPQAVYLMNSEGQTIDTVIRSED